MTKRNIPKKISMSEFKAEVDLPSLMNYTACRTDESQRDVFNEVPIESLQNLTLIIFQWGFDGSTGQSDYKHMRLFILY